MAVVQTLAETLIPLSGSDEQIVEMYRASGDAAVLGALVERHLPQVRNLAYRLVLCHAAADDVAQEVFLKVMRHAGTFRGASKFSTWLYRVTVNAAREQLRKRAVTTALSDHEALAASNSYNSPAGDAMSSELLDSVEQALHGLTDKLRTAIVLTAIEGLPAKEAAAIEGCSTATMHWRVHEARKQLKHTLDPHIKS